MRLVSIYPWDTGPASANISHACSFMFPHQAHLNLYATLWCCCTLTYYDHGPFLTVCTYAVSKWCLYYRSSSDSTSGVTFDRASRLQDLPANLQHGAPYRRTCSFHINTCYVGDTEPDTRPMQMVRRVEIWANVMFAWRGFSKWPSAISDLERLVWARPRVELESEGSHSNKWRTIKPNIQERDPTNMTITQRTEGYFHKVTLLLYTLEKWAVVHIQPFALRLSFSQDMGAEQREKLL